MRCASFGRAAETLHITQPALSKSIRNLEQSLDVVLLERHSGGVVPTPYGKVLYDYASFVTTELNRAVDEIDHMRGKGQGVVRVGAGTSLLQYFLPEAVKAFAASGEVDTIQVRQGLREALLPLLRRGEVDIIVGSVNPEQCPSDLAFELLMTDDLCVVASADHPLAGRPQVAFEDMVDYKWIIPDVSEPEGNRLFRAFETRRLPPPQTAVRTGSSVFMASLLRDSQYLSYLPRALIHAHQDYRHLQPINTPAIWDTVHVGVTYRRKGIMLPTTRRFITQLKAVAQDMADHAPVKPVPPQLAEER